MVEAKVRLSFMVPGAILLSSQECDKNPKESYNYQKLVVEAKGRKKKETHKDVFNIKTRKARPAKQVLTICKEAYEYMISNEGKPEQMGSKLTKARWLQMSAKQRLNVHMQQITESLGGFNCTYEILDD